MTHIKTQHDINPINHFLHDGNVALNWTPVSFWNPHDTTSILSRSLDAKGNLYELVRAEALTYLLYINHDLVELDSCDLDEVLRAAQQYAQIKEEINK